MEKSASTLKRISLELGGSEPMIIMKNADLDAAVKGATRRIWRNMGKICIAVNRIYVEKSVYEGVLEKLKKSTETLMIGNGLTEKSDFGPMCTAEGIETVKRHIKDALEKGVRLICGESRPEGEIGVISGVEDDISSDKQKAATFDDTVDFIERSGIDAIAPAIGTAHGVYKNAPKLNWELIEQIGKLEIPLVVHGGTGLSEETFHKLISLGAAKINISTALKNVYLGTSKKLLADKIAPVPFDVAVYEACRNEMEKYIRLFAGEDIKL